MGDVIRLDPPPPPTDPGPPWGERITLEWILERVLGLTGHAPTHAQRAICRVAAGQPLDLLWLDPTVKRIFGDARPLCVAPKYMTIIAGIRGAKSLMASGQAIVASQTVPVEHLSPGDEIRIPVLSTEVDLAHIVFSHLLGTILSVPELTDLLVGKPKADSLVLRHPSGRHIEIKVTAMARAGTTLVGRWLAGCIFDEAPRMMGDGNVKSLGESLRSIGGRLLPGAQVWMIGSPHAPFGPVYDRQAKFFGNPTETDVVVRARGPDLNPVWWTDERCEAQRLEDEDVYLTDVLAEFSDPEECLISSADLDACMRDEEEGVLQPTRDKNGEVVFEHVAAMDPATRGNAWTLGVLDCPGTDKDGQPLYRLMRAKQWIGSRMTPLSPRKVLGEIRDEIKPYGLTDVMTDQWSIDTMRDLAETQGLSVQETTLDADNRLKMAKRVAMLLRMRRLSLPYDMQLRTDLLLAKNRVTANGATLVLPQTGDGRHCDYLPLLMLATNNPPEPPAAPEPPPPHGDFQDEIDRLDSPEGGWERVASTFL